MFPYECFVPIRYYYLELCNASLDQAFLDDGDPRKYRGPLPIKEDILLQLAEGMKYIYDNGLIYAKIKPRNVLIYSADADSSVLMKWADFGLSNWLLDVMSAMKTAKDSSDVLWLAPEIKAALRTVFDNGEPNNQQKQRQLSRYEKENLFESNTNKSDVYSEGLVFLFVLLDGKLLEPPNNSSTTMQKEFDLSCMKSI